jgi:hypothetical protein
MISNNFKDDVFTIKLPESDLIFTRYLYIKDEVRLSLLVSILKKSDDAIFWAYELFYSGFKSELFDLLWKIYYDFFATLNPSFEAYLKKKHKDLVSNNNSNDKIVSSIIQDLLFRPFNTDVFFLRNICENFEIDIDLYNNIQITDLKSLKINMEKWIENDDYRSIAQWILNDNKNKLNEKDIYDIVLDIFEKKKINSKVKNEFFIKTDTVLLSKIMCLFSKKKNLKKGKSIYIKVEPEGIIPYETINIDDNLKSYKILENGCICGIDDFKHLSLFKLNRYKFEVNNKYWYNWLYHASFSPIWSYRIREFKAYPDYNKKKIVFLDDDLEDEFYKLYGLEPDEQKRCIQEKSIINIEKIYDWKWFEKTYKKNGLFNIYEEELEEFDKDGLKY